MRTEILKFLVTQAEIDPDIYLIVGDLGFSVVEEFMQKFPTRFINAGIAEQNMIGMAAGLAMAGKHVYAYSIIPFITMRCYEQIRNDLCDQKLRVKLIGVGGGFSYGADGMTHHALEDIAIMRTLPEMTVVCPGSKFETRQLAEQIHALETPTYIRLAANEELVTYPDPVDIKLGKVIEIIKHPTQFIVATSNALDLAYQVCTDLAQYGINIGLLSLPTVKPLDTEFFLSKNISALFTIEEHFIFGGIGELIAHELLKHGRGNFIFHSFGVDDFYFRQVGNRSYLKEQAHLSVQHIVAGIKNKLAGQTVLQQNTNSQLQQQL